MGAKKRVNKKEQISDDHSSTSLQNNSVRIWPDSEATCHGCIAPVCCTGTLCCLNKQTWFFKLYMLESSWSESKTQDIKTRSTAGWASWQHTRDITLPLRKNLPHLPLLNDAPALLGDVWDALWSLWTQRVGPPAAH